MNVKLKICGLRRMEDIGFANEFHPDYIGFVFAESRRQVSPRTAAILKENLHPGIPAVGVFVNSSADRIADLVRDRVIDLVQLHGNEDAAYMEQLKKRIPGTPVIKCIRVSTAADFSGAEDLPCEYLLLDTGQMDGYGGSGIQFDWSLIPPLKKPYFLAGGLTAATMELACRLSPPPFCLDLSSAAEVDGSKDRSKIQLLTETIRRINKWQTEDLASTADSSSLKL